MPLQFQQGVTKHVFQEKYVMHLVESYVAFTVVQTSMSGNCRHGMMKIGATA